MHKILGHLHKATHSRCAVKSEKKHRGCFKDLHAFSVCVTGAAAADAAMIGTHSFTCQRILVGGRGEEVSVAIDVEGNEMLEGEGGDFDN